MPDKTFDAVLAPADYPAGKVQYAKLLALKQEFGPVLGSKLVHTRSVGGGLVLLTGDTHGVSLYHGDSHPEAGRERYDWLDRGDGVMFGMLTESARAADLHARTGVDPGVQVRAARLDTQVGQYRDRRAALDAKADRTDDEQRELDKLVRFLAVMDPGGAAAPGPAPAPRPAPSPAPRPSPKPAPEPVVPAPAAPAAQNPKGE